MKETTNNEQDVTKTEVPVTAEVHPENNPDKSGSDKDNDKTTTTESDQNKFDKPKRETDPDVTSTEIKQEKIKE